MRFAILAAALLLTVSCNDTEPIQLSSEFEGAYILVSLRNEPLPARAPCSPLRVQSAHLGLGQFGRASYQVWLIDNLTEQVVMFDAVGSYHIDGDVIVVNVTGGWSVSSQNTSSVFEFEIVADGVLARRNVGGECDASDTEIYERGVVIPL
jgi:hypothetical protein